MAGRSAIFGDLELRERVVLEGTGDGVAVRVINTAAERFSRKKELLRKLQPFWYDMIVRPQGALDRHVKAGAIGGTAEESD